MQSPEIPTHLSVPQFLFGIESDQNSEVPWLVDSATGNAFTREKLLRRCRALAQTMRSRFAVKPDDIVCIVSGNHVDYATVFWASHLIGASSFVTNPGFSVEELAPQFQEAKPTLYVVQPEIYLTVRDALTMSNLDPKQIILMDLPSVHAFASLNVAETPLPSTVQELVDLAMAEDHCKDFEEVKLEPQEGRSKVAILFPSSGTTGTPKLIAVSHYAFIANVLQAIAHDHSGAGSTRYNPGDVSCAVLPFFHILGFLINLHHPIASGMTVVVVSKFHFQLYVEIIEKYRVTHILIVPPILLPFIKNTNYNPSSISSLRVVAIAGAPLSNAVLNFARLIPQAAVGQIYGMTESGALTAPSLTSTVPAFTTHSGVTTCSVGKMLPGIVSRVVREDGLTACQGEKGELWVQTPSAALGYAGQYIESETFSTNGWLRTGDEVYFDENGELFVVQRLKEFMKIKGFRVNPAEIEARLLEHPDVAECCVVSAPHEFSGEVPKAYIVLTATSRKRIMSLNDEAMLKVALEQHAAKDRIAYKHLGGGIEFLDSIPKTSSGKPLRRVLRS